MIASGEDYFVGADDRTSVLELARLVATAMGQPAQPIVHLDARNEVLEAEASHAKLRCAMVPWEPTPTLALAPILPPTITLTLTLASHSPHPNQAPWEPTPLAEGLRITAAYVRQHGARGFEPTGYRAIEVHKSMPASWRAWLAQADAAPPQPAAASAAGGVPATTTLPLLPSAGAVPGAGALLLSFAAGVVATLTVLALVWRWRLRGAAGVHQRAARGAAKKAKQGRIK